MLDERDAIKTITKRKNGTRRVQLDVSEPQITDQSGKQAADINTIMDQYRKTGMLPQQTVAIPKYQDNTGIQSLEEAFNVVNSAVEQFEQLPAEVRRLMDNDPAQLENFISDEKNADTLKKYGLILEQKDTTTLKDVVTALKEQKELKDNLKPTEKV